MLRIVYIVQSLDTGEFLAALDGEPDFTLDLTKAYQFQSVNDAVSHGRIIDHDLERVSIVQLFVPSRL